MAAISRAVRLRECPLRRASTVVSLTSIKRVVNFVVLSCFIAFPPIIAGGDYFIFRIIRGRLFKGKRLIFEGGDYFKYSSLEVVP